MDNSKEYNYKKIDNLIHSRIRLAIMTILVTNDEADFNFLKQKTGATDGNLSSHLSTLEEADYLESKKRFVDKKPLTTYQLTQQGRQAFEGYIGQLEKFINPD